MNCPWCPFDGMPRALHAHLAEAHPEGVRFEERAGRSFYAIACPTCGDGYEHQIKPRGRDPEFVSQFEAQIRLVAFDMLVNHLMAEHGEGVEPTTEEEGAGQEPGVADESVPPPTALPTGGPEWLVQARREAEARPGRGVSPEEQR